MDHAEIYNKLAKTVRDVLKEHGVKEIDFNSSYKDWAGVYPIEDSILRMAKVIAQLNEGNK